MSSRPHAHWPIGRVFLLVVALLVTPRAALACPVCFGETAAPLSDAINLGILFMLGFVAAMLTAFAVFFVRLARRARTMTAHGAESGASLVTTPLHGEGRC